MPALTEGDSRFTWNAGFRVWGLGFRVQGSGFKFNV
jgi:hypothetical protein